MSKILNFEKYVVEKTLNWDEYINNEKLRKYSIPEKMRSNTDIFNKPSRTTVCFYGAGDSKVMYCENCDETHYNNMDLIMELRNYVKDKKLHLTSVVCKKCGSSYNSDDIRVIHRSRYANYSDARLIYDKIYSENDLIKLSIKSCNMVVEKAFYSVDNRYKLIFNTKTGQTYIFNAPENKKNKIRFIHTYLPITNVTYNAELFDMPFGECLIDTENPAEYKVNIFKEIYSLIYEKISNNLGYKPKGIDEYAKESDISNEKHIYSASVLALYNRFPNMNPFILKNMNRDIYGFVGRIIPLRKMRKIKNISKNPIEELLKSYNVLSTELFLECIKDNPKDIYKIIYYSTFFKNPKYIKNLLDESIDSGLCNSASRVNTLIKGKYSLENAVTYLLKHILKEKGEDNLYKLLDKYLKNKVRSNMLITIAEYYYTIKKINPKLKVNLDEVYDFLLNSIEDDDLFFLLNSIEGDVDDDLFGDNEEEIKVIKMFTGILDKSLHELYEHKFNFRVKNLDEYYKEYAFQDTYFERNNINVSNIYKHAPTFNPYKLSFMLGIESFKYGSCTDIELPEVLKSMSPLCTDVLGYLFNYYKIPNVKSLRKKIIKNPKLFKYLVYYNSLFTDVNILNNLLDANCTLNISKIEHVERIIVDDSDYDKYGIQDYQISVYRFIKRLINEQGEVIASRKIINAYVNNISYYINDIGRMFINYINLYKSDNINLHGGIKDIHDRLMKLTGGMQTPLSKEDLKPYRYSEEFYNLLYENNGYSFHLAKNGIELATIGVELNNCVASYSRDVRKGKCLIVPVIFENEYKICIELNPTEGGTNKYKLRQAKLNSNKEVYNDKEALEVVRKWMELNAIEDSSLDIIPMEDIFDRHNHDRDIIDDFDIDDYYGIPF